jgi:MSHA biogenesis protein MshE
MRQDPDVIMVGEIRDKETADMAVQAALTGHLVFSTLHTKDAASTPIRLIDMGAPAYLVATSIHAVLAQRLLRVVCESCAQPYTPDERDQTFIAGAEVGALSGARFKRGRGCSHCNGSGYAGRIGVYELMEMTRDLVRAAGRADPAEFIRAARHQLADQTLTHNALRLAATGKTTLEEVMRLANQIEEA